MILLAALGVSTPPAVAIVGQAESFDEFRAEDLALFHSTVADEERSRAQTQIDRYQELLAMKDKDKAMEEELEALKAQLLSIPKRDRWQFMLTGDYTYDANVDRVRKQREWNGDSIMNVNANTVLDLSGRKTELKLEGIYGRQWNWVFSERDFYQVGSRLRYRRRYFRKTQHAMQLNVNRHNSKTVEIDSSGGKLRYDFGMRHSLNHTLTRKLSWNGEIDFTKRLFVQEVFDQDSQWQVGLAPSAFWNFSRKSRVSLGYRFGASRIRTKAGDSNSHGITLGYFGQITRKSSASINFEIQRQTPRSFETPKERGVTVGVGYILQLTPKTQLTTQIIRNVQNTTSTSTSTTDESATTRTDSHFTNTSVTISLNSNLNRKISVNLSFTPSYLTTETFEDGDQSSETSQWNWPVNVTLRWILTRWLNVNFGYTFDYRRGKSNVGTYRTHVFKMGANMSF